VIDVNRHYKTNQPYKKTVWSHLVIKTKYLGLNLWKIRLYKYYRYPTTRLVCVC